MQQDQPQHEYPDDVSLIRVDDREIYLVGTAHISKESADLVREVISGVTPDCVCVELDERRYEALSKRKQWEDLDLRQVLKQRQLATLIVNLLLAAYQRKLGASLGVLPGAELLEAVRVAEEAEIPYRLCDRDVRVTVLRSWRCMSLWQRAKTVSGLIFSAFGDTELSEEDLRQLRQGDVLTEMMNELAVFIPTLKRVLIDERDAYLAAKILDSPGQRIVAVVGAGHVAGLRQLLTTSLPDELDEYDVIPPASQMWKVVGWGIPLAIIASLAALAWTQGARVAGDNLLFWILANGIPSSIGAALALAHPLTVLTAFVAAPITSLTPVIGAGYVTAFVQAYLRPPRVIDFETVSDQATNIRLWWKNRLLHVLLVFLLPGFGSFIGTYVGAFEIFSNLF